MNIDRNCYILWYYVLIGRSVLLFRTAIFVILQNGDLIRRDDSLNNNIHTTKYQQRQSDAATAVQHAAVLISMQPAQLSECHVVDASLLSMLLVSALIQLNMVNNNAGIVWRLSKGFHREWRQLCRAASGMRILPIIDLPSRMISAMSHFNTSSLFAELWLDPISSRKS